jgi:uncharacterized protein with GYD domain
MPTYISQLRWTPAGAAKLKDSPARLDAARKTLASKGVTIVNFYLTMGRDDMVIIADAPDDQTLAAAVLSVIANGGVTAETSRAFTEDEYRGIFSSLP